MRIIERTELNPDLWDALVSKHSEGSFFSYSWYLDAVAENWCVITDDAYSCGMVLPYTRRAGMEILYIPIFGRFVTPFGEFSAEWEQMISERFKIREIATSSPVFSKNESRVHQSVSDWNSHALGSQAKRSLKKANKMAVSCTDSENSSAVLEAVHSELSGKFKGVNEHSIKALNALVESARKRGHLKVFEVSNGSEKGGIVCLVDANQVLYLKGACPDSLKNNGGMYLAIHSAMEFAKTNGLKFDFGGSNVAGVRKFNENLGGQSQAYFWHEANEGPVWFRVARQLKERLGRNS